jgi:hypothetical protein
LSRAVGQGYFCWTEALLRAIEYQTKAAPPVGGAAKERGVVRIGQGLACNPGGELSGAEFFSTFFGGNPLKSPDSEK